MVNVTMFFDRTIGFFNDKEENDDNLKMVVDALATFLFYFAFLYILLCGETFLVI